MFEQIRREVDEAFNRNGMKVGLPKVTVDASQLKHLLDHHDAHRDEAEKLRGLLLAILDAGDTNDLEDAIATAAEAMDEDE